MFEHVQLCLSLEDELLVAGSRMKMETTEVIAITTRLTKLAENYPDVIELLPMHTNLSFGWVVRFHDEMLAARVYVGLYNEWKHPQRICGDW